MESPTVLPAGGVGTRTRWRWVLFCVFLFGVILLPFALFDGRMNVLVQDSLQSGTSLTLITLAVIGFLTVEYHEVPTPHREATGASRCRIDRVSGSRSLKEMVWTPPPGRGE